MLAGPDFYALSRRSSSGPPIDCRPDLEYEIPKYDGDLGSPNVFVHLDQATCQRKVQGIVETFQTQQNRHWFTADTFLALLRLRGIESAAPGGYAEAFYSRKVVFNAAPGA